jgi:rhodanese-related sulfurtransferase
MGWSVSSESFIDVPTLLRLAGQQDYPTLIDVRREDAFATADRMIAGACWRDPRQVQSWHVELQPPDPVVVYCAHGQEVSQAAVARLRALGHPASYLVGGFDAWATAGGPTLDKTARQRLTTPMHSGWITRARPKIDRIACPWLIRRFIDPAASIHFVSPTLVVPIARELEGIPFDVPDVEFSHVGELCSFDALIRGFGITDPVLDRLAVIVRGADTGRLELAPQCAGLLAVSLGLSATCADDAEMLRRGMLVYDALYGWLRLAAGETHTWTPPAA